MSTSPEDQQILLKYISFQYFLHSKWYSTFLHLKLDDLQIYIWFILLLLFTFNRIDNGLRGQMYSHLRKHQPKEKRCKSTKNTMEIEESSLTHTKKTHKTQSKHLWRDNKLTDQQQKWQTNSEGLIAFYSIIWIIW